MSIETAFIRLALTAASRNRLSVLIYHRVLPEPDELLPGEPCAAEFDRAMRLVKSTLNVIPLADGVRGIKTGKLPTRALSITFDDGYANNATVAAPILSRLGLHATFFIATGFLDGGRMFNDTVIEAVRGFNGAILDLEFMGLGRYPTRTPSERRQAVAALLKAIKYRPESERGSLAEQVADAAGVRPPQNLMMKSSQAAWLAESGFALGGHTVSHPILSQLHPATAQDEIARGRKRLEELTGSRVGLFAYPNGRPDQDYGVAATRLVRELGFDGAVSTSRGTARVGSDPFQIPRFTPWDLRPLRFTAQLASNLLNVEPTYAAA